MPGEDQPFTEDITKQGLSSTTEAIDFTETFNGMIAGTPLTIKYEINFGDELIIENDPDAGPQVLKAELALLVPLKLKPSGTDDATIDVTKHMGEMKNKNLLDFAENTGDGTQISFTTLRLDVKLNGSVGGKLIIERDKNKDGVDADHLTIALNRQNIPIDLTGQLGPNQSFTPTGLKLKIDKDGYLQIPRGLSLLQMSVNADVDFTYDF
jgi:hypothetical protein